jgi:intracellular sulfur oxidation DsrE/DsrF family protein
MRLITGIATVAMFALMPGLSQAQQATQSKWVKSHRVVIQIDSNDSAIYTLALNNAENMRKYYQQKGEPIQIEFVAFGPGLTMMLPESPVKDRLVSMSHEKGVTFSGCGNTLSNRSQAENKLMSLLPEAHLVPTGVARITELQESGWTYLRP